MHTQPSLNEVPAPTLAQPTSSQTPPPSNEGGGERKRPAPAGDGDENIDPDDKPPKTKQPRTIEIELTPSSATQDNTGMDIECEQIKIL
jgi:hypothetical protein